MKKIFTFLILFFAIFNIKAVAQNTTDCNANFTFVISGNSVQFTPAAGTDSTFIYHHWKFGDTSAILFGPSPTHVYPGPGTYIVTQYVAKSSNSAGSPSCSDSVKETIIIPAATPCGIYSAYSFARDSIQPNTIHFTNLSKAYNTINYVRWYFGDSTYSTTYSPSHTFTKPGSYTVCLLVKYDSLSSCSADSCMTIFIPVIDPLPCNLQAYFNSTVDSLQSNIIHFHNYTTNIVTSDSSYWDFGDSTTARDTNPSHTYTQSGTYNICLTVTRVTTPGTVPCTSKFCRTVTVTVPVVCNFSIGYSWKLDSLNHNKVYFTNTSNVTNGSVKWSFGDGSALDSTWNTSHTFSQAGKYNVCLRIQTNTNCVKYQCDTVTIPAAVACNLKASFTTYKDSTALAANTYYFLNTSSPASSTDSAFWNFGDGSPTVYSLKPTHTYAQTGTYTVCLYVKRATIASTTPCVSNICDTLVIPTVCDIQPSYTWKLDSLNPNKVIFTNTTFAPTALAVPSNWFFGDDSSSTSWNASHVYAKPGTYYVCLRVQPSANCVKYQCDSIKIPAPFVCNLQTYFNSTTDSLHAYGINFHDYTTNLLTTDSSYWDFGDSTTSRDLNPNHIYTRAGTYNVCLTITRIAAGTAPCISKFCRTIVIQPLCNLKVAYTWKVDSLHQNTIDFTNTTTAIPITGSLATWSFGDGSAFDSSWNATHTYTQPGKYYVCLRIQTNNTCINYQCDSITVPAPVCNFQSAYTWQLDSRTQNTVDFTNTTVTNVTGAKALWFFGDGTSDSTWSVNHTFTQPGKYYVCLRVQLNPTCYKYQCDSITIPAPVCNVKANYTWEVDSLKQNTIDFTNTTITTVTSQSVRWAFGDGSPLDSTWNTKHTYAQPGKYYVCLRIQTNANCVSYQCDSVTVPAPACNFQPAYTWQLDTRTQNTVDFTNTTVANVTGAKALWFFGDGTSDSTWSVNHTFAQPGKYYVCLRVQLNSTCYKYQCDSITIPSPVVCNIQSYFYDNVDSLQYNKYHFTNETLNLVPTDSLYWSFGDSTASRDANPIHIYANAGTYNACLTVTRIAVAGTAPCTSKFCRTIIIQPVCNLTAGFSYTRDSLAANLYTYQFTNTSTSANGYDSSYWNFGDGSSASYDKNPVHAFAQSGSYTVCLYIKKATTSATATACTSHICITIVVPDICSIQPNYTWKADSLSNSVSFTNTTIPYNNTATVNWFFGDGTSATSWNAAHTYAQSGKYYVCLRIQTSTNCIKYKCDSITVSTPAPACKELSLFTFTTSSTSNQYFSFTPNYQSTALKYTWTFGDGTGSENIISKHLYTSPGIYTACLTAYRDSNCASTTCKQIPVRPVVNCDSIHISYNYYKDPITANKLYFHANFNFLSLQQPLWTITHLTNTIDPPVVITRNNPTYIFNDTGYYNICLKTTIEGCNKEYCNTIHITSIATPCELQVYPNPVHTQVSVNVELTSPELIHAYVYNVESILLEQVEQQGTIGSNIVNIKTGNLVAGFYTIKLIYGNNTCYAKFQKL